MSHALTENDLFELVADFGEFICIALRRDHYLSRMIDAPEKFVSLAEIIGHERAAFLKDHPESATETEVRSLIEKQIHEALDAQNPEITPTIWLCESDNGQITMIEGWGEDLNTYLSFRVVGHYASRESALDDLHRLYFTNLSNQ